ncbi:hypothetical protein PI86_05775 [Burkholderia sp. A9]|nr:hypothetical protein PI86_05775 [Burkholderia sp. A9]
MLESHQQQHLSLIIRQRRECAQEIAAYAWVVVHSDLRRHVCSLHSVWTTHCAQMQTMHDRQ